MRTGTGCGSFSKSIRSTWAAESSGTLEVIEALLNAGADPNARIEYGETALHRASSRSDNPAFIEALVDVGADPNARLETDEMPWDVIPAASPLRGTDAY